MHVNNIMQKSSLDLEQKSVYWLKIIVITIDSAYSFAVLKVPVIIFTTNMDTTSYFGVYLLLKNKVLGSLGELFISCLLYTSPSPRD